MPEKDLYYAVYNAILQKVLLVFNYFCLIDNNYIYCINLIIKYKYAYNSQHFK